MMTLTCNLGLKHHRSVFCSLRHVLVDLDIFCFLENHKNSSSAISNKQTEVERKSQIYRGSGAFAERNVSVVIIIQ